MTASVALIDADTGRRDTRMASRAPRFRRSRIRDGLLLGACAIALSGCGTIHSARMLFPKASGMDEVDRRLYVEPSMTTDQRRALQRQIEAGRAAVVAFYGDAVATPYIVACITSACDTRFGSYGQRAAAYGDLAIRLSPRGLSAPLIAHEWSHAEVFRRAGGWWYARRIPRWFDEGIAVVLADEPRHSEENWREIQRRGLPTPRLGELRSFGDWGLALEKYGETAGDVPGNLRVVYTAVGHEIRTFLSCAGTAGVVSVLGSVRAGSSFEDAYAAAKATCIDRPS